MKKPPKKTTILDETQVRTLTGFLTGMLAGSLPEGILTAQHMETLVRMMALSAKCLEAREKRGLSIKDVALQLRVPQYRIRAIEDCDSQEIESEILHPYIAFLGLTSWFRRWAAANRTLVQRMGIDKPPDRPSKGSKART